ncbi:hypothetical protein EDD11_006346 [Mortierella claussenii]|nr:hypothetical protein EDD11_006346 [Mortierella claussenii]
MSSPYNNLFTGGNILLLAKTVTIASMGIASGVGLSYNAMIMPSIQKLSPMNSLAVFCRAASPAMSIQVSAIAVSLLGGTLVYNKTKNRSFLYGSMIMLSVLPYTVFMFFPINRALFSMNKTGVDDGTIGLRMQQWNRYQYGRTLLNVTALLVTLFGGLEF